MPRTGRQPYATTDVLPFGSGTRRLRPPDGLSDAAKAAFLDLVTTCPADQFQPSDMYASGEGHGGGLFGWAADRAQAASAATFCQCQFQGRSS